MKLQATHKDITLEAKSYAVLKFVEEGESFEGLNIFFAVSVSKYISEPVILIDQDKFTIESETITAILTPDQTSMNSKKNWYELWVEWEPNQWQKQFKGDLTLTPSLNYN